ncbi:MAG: metallophosphoesterase [Dorea sp.]|nr:metallophosphoesterase [Dorea sp.]
MRRADRKTWKEKLAVLAGVGLFSLILEIWRELQGFVIRRFRIQLPYKTEKGEAVKLIFLSDLHGKQYGKRNQELIAAIAKERPDYILIGGDLLTRNNESTERTALGLLQRLVKICPVYLANGNHEQRMRMKPEEYQGRYERYIRKAESFGVHVLANETEDCDMKGIPAAISGLEIPLACYAHFHSRNLESADIKERLGKAVRGRYQILLAHSPVYFDAYVKWGADLVLSGHLHGGVIGIPKFGGLITPQAKLFPKYSGGLHRKGKRIGIVSRGLGTHTVNIRLFNPAEVVAVTLNPVKSEVV